MNARPDKHTTCGIVVTHDPDSGFPERAGEMARQAAHIVIVDNHTTNGAQEMLQDYSARGNVSLIRNDENFGIAFALNRGMESMQRLGFPWALLFDQDSTPMEAMADEFGLIYDEFPMRDRIGTIGSNFLELGTGSADIQRNEKSGRPWLESKTVITSGSLLSRSAYEATGAFREEFFIDAVDFDYCLRLKQKGYKVITSVRPLMSHTLGNTASCEVFGRKTRTTNHSPVRRYYMARNNLILIREYFFKEPHWVLSRLASMMEWMVLIGFCEADRKEKLAHLIRGLKDGFVGRMGRFRQ